MQHRPDEAPKTGEEGPLALEVAGLRKNFGSVTAVDDVSFTVRTGGVTALLGGNGAGKTTTIAMILGLVTPTAGRVAIFGEDALAHPERVLPRVNFSSPYVDLPHGLTVRQNLLVYARLYGVEAPRARVEALAADLDLLDFLDRPAGRLSAGQKTRVSIAKALVNGPDLLLLDEPTASLDPDTADWMRGYLEDWRAASGASILLASHNMAEVERLCDDVVMMKAGRVVDRGAPPALLARYGRDTMEEVFLDIARGRARAAGEAQP